MSTIDHLTALADRIRTEAYIADRPGQMGRLEAIAYELEDAEEIIRADEQEKAKVALRQEWRVLGDMRDERDAAKARTVEWMDRYNAQVEAERQSMADLRAKWNDEGHAVLFNHAKGDLTPAQRVGKWLEEAADD